MLDDSRDRERNKAKLLAYLLNSEENERTYRRGYRQGFQMAVDRLGDLVFDNHFNIEDAFIRLQRHGEVALRDWQIGDITARIEPPFCSLAPFDREEEGEES